MKLNPIAAAFSGVLLGMKISKTVDKKYQLLATHNVPCPTLLDLGLEAETQTDDKGATKMENGLALYISKVDQLIHDALVERVKAKAKALLDDEGKLPEGEKFADTWELLTVEAQPTGAALQAYRDAGKSFSAYLEANVKNALGRKALASMFDKPESVSSAKAELVAKFGERVDGWYTICSEGDQERFAKKYAKVLEAVEAGTAEVDAADC